ncbi:MAG: hypothetical protein MI921_16385 [Cytophagales bacterium]|nr:hypothetical protein [Cytophagales bacterium]
MRKIILPFVIVMFSFAACNEDSLEDINPKSDSSNLEVQSTEDDEPRDDEPPPKDEN